MDGGVTVVLSFIGTLIALVITKTVERGYTKTVREAELSRDLIQHLADTLLAVERFIEPLTAPCDLRDTLSLRKVPSSYTWSPLPLKLETLLDVFSDPETHRLIYKFFDRDSLYREASREHEAAFYWLLDEARDWRTDASQERIDIVVEMRRRMLWYTFEMLSTGYQLLEKLYPLADNWLGNLTRGAAAPFYRHLEQEHRLTPASIRQRRAYYDAPFSPPTALRPFRPHVRYGLVILNDERACALLKDGRGRAMLTVHPADGAALQLDVRPHREVAIPEGYVVRGIALGVETDSGEYRWEKWSLNMVMGAANAEHPVPLPVPAEITRLLPA